jgi:hypothetical protein
VVAGRLLWRSRRRPRQATRRSTKRTQPQSLSIIIAFHEDVVLSAELIHVFVIAVCQGIVEHSSRAAMHSQDIEESTL